MPRRKNPSTAPQTPTKRLPARKGTVAPTGGIERANTAVVAQERPTRKNRRYSDDFRAAAVALLEAHGYPNTKGAITAVSNRLQVSDTVLADWFYGRQGSPPEFLLADKKDDLAMQFHRAAELMLAQATRSDKIDAMSAQQAITGAAIAVDKYRLLSGLPTEIVSVLPDADAAAKVLGVNLAMLLMQLVERAVNEAGYQRITITP